MTSRFYLLDALRGIAALVILFWHYQHFYFPFAGSGPRFATISQQPFYDYFEYFYLYGYTAVQFFWVLSGFVLSYAYWDQKVSFKKFFNHRFSRIYPLHFLTLLVVAALQFLSFELFGHDQIYKHNDWYHFLLQLGMASDWGLQEGYSFNAPIWSVSLEIVIYLVFFMCLPLIVKLGGWISPILMAGFLGLILLSAPGPFWWCGFYFFLGSTLFWIWEKMKHPLMVVESAGAALVAAGVVTLFSTDLRSPVSETDLLMFYLGLGSLFGGIILLAAAVEKIFGDSGLVKFSKLGWLGDASYGIYLWHIPVQISSLIFLQYYFPGKNFADHPVFFLGYVTVVTGIAVASFHLFEAPAKRWLRLSRRATASDNLSRKAS